ncbi:Uncharacterised protein [Serratia quinivorans]|uniref:hypothetical protein n=1 Tax=Serratia quinivorans TaxID=137545 RepID=UPI002177F62B|nr:hypothetical protein [Serratia quinivorans]CAI0847187.1 Uncharacterised protein [Serratia quinivorans]
MKGIFLACVAQCYCFSALATVDLQYHAELPRDNKVSDSYQQKRSVLKHKIWSAEALAQANDEALKQEQQHATAERANRRQHNILNGNYRCGKHKQQHGKPCLPSSGAVGFPAFKRHH